MTDTTRAMASIWIKQVQIVWQKILVPNPNLSMPKTLPGLTKGLSPVVKRIREAVEAHLGRLLATLDQGRSHRRRTPPRQPIHIRTTWILSILVKIATIINGRLYQTSDAHQSTLAILNGIQTVVNVNFVLKNTTVKTPADTAIQSFVMYVTALVTRQNIIQNNGMARKSVPILAKWT